MSQFQKVLAQFSELSAISFAQPCTDIWTCATRSFIGVTAHWIDTEDLARKKAAIACKRMVGRHTYDVIAKALVNTMQEYNIQKKTKDAVTDSGT